MNGGWEEQVRTCVCVCVCVPSPLRSPSARQSCPSHLTEEEAEDGEEVPCLAQGKLHWFPAMRCPREGALSPWVQGSCWGQKRQESRTGTLRRQ